MDFAGAKAIIDAYKSRRGEEASRRLFLMCYDLLRRPIRSSPIPDSWIPERERDFSDEEMEAMQHIVAHMDIVGDLDHFVAANLRK